MMRGVRYTPHSSLVGLALVCAGLLLGTARAKAQDQFVLVDVTFTATAMNTMKSQYAIAPLPAAPANWKTPVDWSNGSIHLRYEVLEKPTALKTLGNICFENTNTLTCQPYPPPYTGTGVYQSDSKINTFWQYNVFDWTKKLDRVYVVLKDEKEVIVQGSAQFYPTKLHVTVWVVPPGKTFIPPTHQDDTDAGTVTPTARPDAGPVEPLAPRANPPSAGQSGQVSTAPPQALSTAGRTTAGRTAASAGKPGSPAATQTDAGAPRNVSDYLEHGSSCSFLASKPTSSAKLLGLAIVAAATRRLKRRRLKHLT